MSLLTVSFCGIEMKNPIVVAASPATESIEGIVASFDAGAGAVITKSIGDYDESKMPLGARRAYINKRGLWAISTFRRETLNRCDGVKLIAEASTKTSIPIIASVTASDLKLEHWLPTCLDIQNAGANMIQLDLFYLPQTICGSGYFKELLNLFNDLSKVISVPIIPKLNIEIPAYLAAEYFPKSKIAGLSLLDSIRVPSPVDIERKNISQYNFIQKPGMSSLFGSWQLPLTQHYTLILGRLTSLDLCVGGGLTNAREALESIMQGATLVQFASAILINGYIFISRLIKDLEILLQNLGYKSIIDVQNLILKEQPTDIEGASPIFNRAKVKINHAICNQCKRCLDLTICNAISELEGYIKINEMLCEGCGFCIPFCESNALYLEHL